MRAADGDNVSLSLFCVSGTGKRSLNLTPAIEIVASANGSPIMFPRLMRLRPYWGLEYSIFLSDGESSDPYPGISAGDLKAEGREMVRSDVCRGVAIQLTRLLLAYMGQPVV